MIVSQDPIDLPTGDGGVMRCLLAMPKAPGRYPGIVFYSDIFQLTGPMQRACTTGSCFAPRQWPWTARSAGSLPGRSGT